MAKTNAPALQDAGKRRSLQLLAGGVVAAKAPFVFAKNRTKLRVLGTHVTLQETIRKEAEDDLGIDIEFEPGGGAAVLPKASI